MDILIVTGILILWLVCALGITWFFGETSRYGRGD